MSQPCLQRVYIKSILEVCFSGLRFDPLHRCHRTEQFDLGELFRPVEAGVLHAEGVQLLLERVTHLVVCVEHD